MNKQTEALKMAIEALEESNGVLDTATWKTFNHTKAIKSCKEALKQPAQEPLTRAQQVIRANNSAQEPMAWLSENSSQVTKWKDIAQSWIQHGGKAIPLYTHPEPQPTQKVKVLYEKDGIQTCEILPAPSWQGLSDDEITNMEADHDIKVSHDTWEFDVYGFARAIEQALKEKNNG